MSSSNAQPSTSLPPQITEELRRLVDIELARRMEAVQAGMEADLAMRVAEKLVGWAKILGFAIGLPLILLAAALAVVGIREFADVRNRAEQARTEIEKIQEDINVRRRQLDEVQTLLTAVARIEYRVSGLEAQVRFGPSTDLSEESRQRLKSSLDSLHQYLVSIGFPVPPEPVEIEVRDSQGVGPTNGLVAYYDRDKRAIELARTAVDDLDIAMQQYASVLVQESMSDSLRTFVNALANRAADDFDANASVIIINDLVQALSIYLICSFKGDPQYSSQFDINNFAWNDRDPLAGQGVWAATFWKLRGSLGQQMTEPLLYQAWTEFSETDFRAGVVQGFSKRLQQRDSELHGGRNVEEIQRILQELEEGP